MGQTKQFLIPQETSCATRISVPKIWLQIALSGIPLQQKRVYMSTRAIIIGSVLIFIGALMALGGILKSDFAPIRLLRARAELCWGEYANQYLAGCGIMVVIFGVLFATGVIPERKEYED